MTRPSLLLLLAGVLALACASAQAQECAQEVAQATAQASADVKAAQDSAEAWKAYGESEVAKLNAQVAELTVQLAGCKTDLSLSDITEAVGKLATSSASSATDEAKAIFEDLKQGNATRLNRAVSSTMSTALFTSTTAMGSVSKFVVREADEHAPFIRKHVEEAYGKVADVYAKNLASNPAVQKVEEMLSFFNDVMLEVVSEFTPGTPWDNDANKQTLAYVLMSGPFILTFFVMIKLASRSKKAPAGKKGRKVKRN